MFDLFLEMIQSNTKYVFSKKFATTYDRISSLSAFTTSLRDRPVVHSPQHIDDLGRRRPMSANERRYLLDEGSLLMTNDPNSLFYWHLRETLKQQNPIDTRLIREEEKFKLFEKYDPELIEFLKDRDGHLKSRFDKVFIT